MFSKLLGGLTILMKNKSVNKNNSGEMTLHSSEIRSFGKASITKLPSNDIRSFLSTCNLILQHKDIQHRSLPFRHSVSSVRLTQSLEASGRHRFRLSMSDTRDCQAKGYITSPAPHLCEGLKCPPDLITWIQTKKNEWNWVNLEILRLEINPSLWDAIRGKQIKLGCLDIGQHRKSNQQQKIVPSR